MKNIYTKNVKEKLNYVDNNKIRQRKRKISLPVPIFVFPPNILVFLDWWKYPVKKLKIH